MAENDKLFEGQIPVTINFDQYVWGKATGTKDADGNVVITVAMKPEEGRVIIDLLTENKPLALAWTLRMKENKE